MSMFWIGYAAGFVTFPVVFGLLALGFLLLVPHWPNPTCGLSCIPCDETLIEDDSTRCVLSSWGLRFVQCFSAV